MNLDKYKFTIDTTTLLDHEIELWFGIESVKVIRSLEKCILVAPEFEYNTVHWILKNKSILKYHYEQSIYWIDYRFIYEITGSIYSPNDSYTEYNNFCTKLVPIFKILSAVEFKSIIWTRLPQL